MKTKSDYMKTYRKKLRARGLMTATVVIPAQERDRVMKYCEKLRKQHERAS